MDRDLGWDAFASGFFPIVLALLRRYSRWMDAGGERRATHPLRVLFVEGSETEVERVARELRAGGHAFESTRVDTAETMRSALAGSRFDLVISDWALPAFSAREALAVAAESGLAAPFIVVSEAVGEEAVADVMRSGAHDFVVKTNMARLTRAVERELYAQPPQQDDQDHQAQKLEAIGQLAGSVAHDFSNLLSIILSYTDLVIAELGSGDPLRSDLLEVQRAGQRAAWLTGQLLAFGRRQTLQPRLLDLDDVIADMEKMIRRLIGEDIELVVNRTPGLRLIRVDPGQIEQVLMNLAVNARDAMPHGGRLTIETANVELAGADTDDGLDPTPGAHVMLSMTDTGSGMDEATRARIFEPFFTTKEKGKGTGLGLSTVLGIVQQSGGSVSVDSRPGAGTSFKIYFTPVEGTTSVAAPIVPRPLTDPRGGETVLLVEDDEPLRVLARGILRRYGYQVLEAQGAGDALLISEQHKESIHLLLTDVVMPRISGRQLADRLMPLRPEMRVLYMSGYAREDMRRYGILETGSPLLQKPITPEALGRKVRETLDEVHEGDEVDEGRGIHEAHPCTSRR
jgi:two-component system cell cycle sensor histidine kinase/response regulator CckA